MLRIQDVYPGSGSQLQHKRGGGKNNWLFRYFFIAIPTFHKIENIKLF
jgi:hypothetical protein